MPTVARWFWRGLAIAIFLQYSVVYALSLDWSPWIMVPVCILAMVGSVLTMIAWAKGEEY